GTSFHCQRINPIVESLTFVLFEYSKNVEGYDEKVRYAAFTVACLDGSAGLRRGDRVFEQRCRNRRGYEYRSADSCSTAPPSLVATTASQASSHARVRGCFLVARRPNLVARERPWAVP